MPKLLNQLNHEEVKLNSELQFRNQKKREAESRRNRSSKNFARLRNFTGLQNFATCKIALPLPLFTFTVPFDFCSSFDFFPFYPCNS